MLNSSALNAYIDSFFGYGRWNAPVWFIGIEEAGGRTEREIEERLNVWTSRRRNELEDAPTFYPAMGNRAWHGKNPTLQATWKQLIRMLLLARGECDDDKTILNYQTEQLGSSRGDTCLAELLPLPSPDTSTWNYSRWFDLHRLSSRQSYQADILGPRADALKMRCASYRPQIVIFYGLEISDGTKLLPYWSRIAGGWFEQAIERKKILLHYRNEQTAFFVTRHPAIESASYFREIGTFFRDNYSTHFPHLK
jgi:hypothetical protein